MFDKLEGFDERFRRPSIEDIELGVRLKRAGGKIVVDKSVLCTHRKRWTLWSMIKCDIRDRAIPWTSLLLREKHLPNKLNLGWSQRFSMLLSYAFLGTLFLRPVPLVPIACVIAIVLLNWRYYRFFCRQRGTFFAAAVVPFQILFYTYSGMALGLGILDHLTAGPANEEELPLQELAE
jgi:GT2 family glycosyltransferase